MTALQETLKSSLDTLTKKPTKRWNIEHDIKLSTKIAEILLLPSEKIFTDQIEKTLNFRNHFLCLIYQGLGAEIQSDTNIDEVINGTSLGVIIGSAKQDSTKANQLFTNLEKPFSQFKNFVDASSHIDITTKRHDGKNCLHLLAENSKIEDFKQKIDFLLTKELDINSRTTEGETPLMISIKAENFEVFNYLKGKDGCDITLQDSNNKNLLHILLESYNPAKPNQKLVTIIAEIIGTDKISLTQEDTSGKTPLNLIVEKDLNLILTSTLRDHSDHLSDRDWEGIVTDAIKYNHEAILKKALTYSKAKRFVNEAGSDGKSLAQVAVEHDNADILKLLKENGADFSVQDDNGNRLGHLATTKTNVFKYLTKEKYLDLDLKNSFGETIPTLAAKQGSKQVIDILLEEHKQSIKEIFIISLSFGNLEIVKHILEDKHKIKLNDKGTNTVDVAIYEKYKLSLADKEYGENILHKAISAFSGVHKDKSEKIIETIKYFLKFIKGKFDLINDLNLSGQTPLHLTIMNDKIDLFKALLENGANINQKNSIGISPIHFAIQENRGDFIQELLKLSNLDLCDKNTKSQTILHEAAKGEDIAIFEMVFKAISTRTDLKGLFLHEDNKKNTFLHFLTKNTKIDTDKKAEMLKIVIPNLKDDEFKGIFDKPNESGETIRKLILEREELKQKTCDLPEYVEPTSSVKTTSSTKTKTSVKLPQTIESTQIDLESLREEVLYTKTDLHEFREEFRGFQSQVLEQLGIIQNLLGTLSHHTDAPE